MTEAVSIELSEADAAILRDWAANAETDIQALLRQAVTQYIADGRADHAELERRMLEPGYTIEEVRTRLAGRRRSIQAEAAE